jgi:hypothetical protein
MMMMMMMMMQGQVTRQRPCCSLARPYQQAAAHRHAPAETVVRQQSSAAKVKLLFAALPAAAYAPAVVQLVTISWLRRTATLLQRHNQCSRGQTEQCSKSEVGERDQEVCLRPLLQSGSSQTAGCCCAPPRSCRDTNKATETDRAGQPKFKLVSAARRCASPPAVIRLVLQAGCCCTPRRCCRATNTAAAANRRELPKHHSTQTTHIIKPSFRHLSSHGARLSKGSHVAPC